MRPSDLFFEQEVEIFLSSFKKSLLTPFQFPPVPVGPICEQYLGLAIQEKDVLKRNAVGMLVEDISSISAQRGNSPFGRFTIAHEIAHWLLHSKSGEGFGKQYRTNLISSSAKKPRTKEVLQEIEANRFAASLLMPKNLVVQAAISRTFSINRVAIDDLAKLFKVSKIAMLFRIKNICKYSKWEGPPIDEEDFYLIEREWFEKHGSNESSRIFTTIFFAEFDDILETDITSLSEQRPISNPSSDSIFNKVFSLPTELAYYRRPSKTKKKLMIEFAGLPNAGKNTQIDFLVNDLRNVGYKVARLEEGFGTASADGRLDGQTQENKLIWSLGKLVQDILNFGLDDSYDIVVLNRGPFDFLALTEWWRIKGIFTSSKALANKDWILQYLKEWVDVVIYLDVTPEESILREKEERKEVLEHLARKYHNIEIYPEQRLVNQMVLEEMRSAYETTISTYINDFVIRKISTPSILQTAEDVLSSTQQFLSNISPHETNGPIQPTLPGFETRSTVMKEFS